MLKEKKGFTLIELLAVIIILGIIMTIIVPQVINVIERSQLKVTENNIRGLMKIVDIAQKEYAFNNGLKELIFTFNDGNEEANVSNVELNYKGKKPKNGIIIINETGEITLAIHDGRYCIEKGYRSDDLSIIEKEFMDCVLEVELGVDISGANPPILLDGMIPIIWNENTNEWIEASNINDPNEQNWYDYEQKKWANAKTVTSNGDTIAYFVWIPRYAYKITNGFHGNNTGSIDVKFINGISRVAIDNTPIETSGYEYEVKDTSMHYFLHPAFKFGNEDIPGFWVAKFEPSENIDKMEILPNKNPVSGSISFCYNEALTMKSYICNNNCDTHMMKNIEWGAVSYLTQSKYGKKGNVAKNEKSVTGGDDYRNNVNQSTTGTIYGIYDMSGNKLDFVMGVFVDGNNRVIGSSGFTQTELNKIPSKYIDEYTTYDDVKNRYGDAIFETSSKGTGSNSWYSVYSKFVVDTSPWFSRGGYYSSAYASVYYFDNNSGATGINSSFRPIAIYSKNNS